MEGVDHAVHAGPNPRIRRRAAPDGLANLREPLTGQRRVLGAELSQRAAPCDDARAQQQKQGQGELGTPHITVTLLQVHMSVISRV